MAGASSKTKVGRLSEEATRVEEVALVVETIAMGETRIQRRTTTTKLEIAEAREAAEDLTTPVDPRVALRLAPPKPNLAATLSKPLAKRTQKRSGTTLDSMRSKTSFKTTSKSSSRTSHKGPAGDLSATMANTITITTAIEEAVKEVVENMAENRAILEAAAMVVRRVEDMVEPKELPLITITFRSRNHSHNHSHSLKEITRTRATTSIRKMTLATPMILSKSSPQLKPRITVTSRGHS